MAAPWTARTDPARRIRIGAITLLAVVVVATAWYWLVEDFGFIEALYQTVITVFTVGFREVRRLDDSGQLFTIVVIVVGVGAAFYTLTGVFGELVEAQISGLGRRRMDRRVQRMQQHAVVCGYGRIGSRVAELLSRDGEVLVVEHDTERAALAAENGFAVIRGDATDEETLNRAHLDAARILVAALPTDADNLYVVLSGRDSSADLRIVARAQSTASDAKLVRAGADRVVNPEDIGAHRLAAFAQRPMVSEFLDVVMHDAIEYRLEEIPMAAGSPLVGLTLREASVRDETGALVLGLRVPDGSFVTNPTPETVLESGSVLIAIGAADQLAELERRAVGSRGR